MEEAKKNLRKISLWELFITFFKINSITFGGGYTIVIVLRDEFVHNKEIISEDDMLDLTALAQSGPGAMAINTSILTGYKLRGMPGAIVCMLASVLPCIIIITTVSYFYQEFSSNFYVNAALKGMSGVIAAVLVITTYNMGKNIIARKPIFSGTIMAAAFSLSYFLGVNSGLLILIFGIFGLVLFSFISEEALK